MILEDEAVLDGFRAAKVCEYCKQKLRHRAEPHHIFSRGAGRIDHPFNLVSIGGAFDCGCHAAHHDGNPPTKSDLLAVASAREKVLQPDIEALVYLIRRLPKGKMTLAEFQAAYP